MVAWGESANPRTEGEGTDIGSKPNGRRELVVLVHGFLSHRLIMWLLGRRLRQAGFAIHNWGYVSPFGPLERHATRLRADLEQLADSADTIHLVAHSMGAIVARLALSQRQAHPGRIVLIAPPNRGAPIARWAAMIIGKICPSLVQISDHPHSFVNQMVIGDELEVGTIAARYDVLVPRASTSLAGSADHTRIAGTHASVLFRKHTARLVRNFLLSGRFRP